MLCTKGAPTAADHATATTPESAMDWPGPDRIGPDWTEPGDHQRPHRDTTGPAIVTSRPPKDIETYNGTPYEKNTVPKNSCAKKNTVANNPDGQNLPYKKTTKNGFRTSTTTIIKSATIGP